MAELCSSKERLSLCEVDPVERLVVLREALPLPALAAFHLNLVEHVAEVASVFWPAPFHLCLRLRLFPQVVHDFLGHNGEGKTWVNVVITSGVMLVGTERVTHIWESARV